MLRQVEGVTGWLERETSTPRYRESPLQILEFCTDERRICLAFQRSRQLLPPVPRQRGRQSSSRALETAVSTKRRRGLGKYREETAHKRERTYGDVDVDYVRVYGARGISIRCFEAAFLCSPALSSKREAIVLLASSRYVVSRRCEVSGVVCEGHAAPPRVSKRRKIDGSRAHEGGKHSNKASASARGGSVGSNWNRDARGCVRYDDHHAPRAFSKYRVIASTVCTRRRL